MNKVPPFEFGDLQFSTGIQPLFTHEKHLVSMFPKYKNHGRLSSIIGAYYKITGTCREAGSRESLLCPIFFCWVLDMTS